MFRRLFTLAAALVVALLPAMATAQVTGGTITGSVKDSSGAPIPGAIVQVINEETRASAEVRE